MNPESSPTAKYLVSNLRRLRGLNFLTQQQVADHVGVSRQSVSRYEKYGPNSSFPEADVIDKLADLYKIHICDLFAPGGASTRKFALGDPDVMDALHILNKYLLKSGFQIIPTTPPGAAP